jgi:DNA-binding FadR family transcriptional regulator
MAEQPIRRASLVDEIVTRVQKEILDGRWVPGQALPPERELAERWGVNRTSLKYALVRMEEVGLIRTKHGVGSIVQDVARDGGADLLKYLVGPEEQPDLLFLREILESRVYIAGAFAALAARRRTKKDIVELTGILEELAKKISDSAEAQRIENLFMRALARAGQNRVFVFVTNSVSAAYKLDLATYAEPFRDGPWLERELRAILDAVVEGDEATARYATEEYFQECARRVLARAKQDKRRSG